MKLRFKIFLLAVSLVIAATACKRDQSQTAPQTITITIIVTDGGAKTGKAWSKKLESVGLPPITDFEAEIADEFSGTEPILREHIACWTDNMPLPPNAQGAGLHVEGNRLISDSGLSLPHICTVRATMQECKKPSCAADPGIRQMPMADRPLIEFYLYGDESGRAEVTFNGREYQVVAFEAAAPVKPPVKIKNI